MQIEQLEEALEEREQKTKKIIDGFTEEIHKRDSLIREYQQKDQQKFQDLLSERQTLEETLIKLNQDYFAYKQNAEIKDRTKEEQIQLLQLKIVKLN